MTEILSRRWLEQNTPDTAPRDYPIRAVQFGEGVFFRAFVAAFIQSMNEHGVFGGRIAAVQPMRTEGRPSKLPAQDCLYTLIARGLEDGKPRTETQVIGSIAEIINPYSEWRKLESVFCSPEVQFVFSNTTEAGIRLDEGDNETGATPPKSFPAKLEALLYRRFEHLAQKSPRIYVIPCELIEDNGGKLRSLVEELAKHRGSAFSQWLGDHVRFCSSLVDRIAAGYPETEAEQWFKRLGYRDTALDTCELYHFWAIENKGAPELAEILPLERAGINAVFADDIGPYRTRKVRILNGAHSIVCAYGLSRGLSTVRQAMENPGARNLLERALLGEIIPAMAQGDERELVAYAHQVMDRFCNPYIEHRLTAIAMNYSSKIRARLAPSISAYHERFGKEPQALLEALAEYIRWTKDRVRSLEDDPNFVRTAEKLWSADEPLSQVAAGFCQALGLDPGLPLEL